MSLKGLVRHPVGRTSAVGRWYLAGATVLALLLLSLHFAVQAEVQQQARDVVSRWAEQQGVTVAGVQYRMMRGALTLDDFHARMNGVELKVATLTLQGDITSFMSSQPRLSLMELRGIELQTGGIPQNFWVSDGSYSPVLSRLWQSARAIVVENGTIHIGSDQGFPRQPVEIELLRFRAQGGAGLRHAKGAFRLLGGRIEVEADESWEHGDVPQLHAYTFWDGIDAASFLQQVTGWDVQAGELDGTVEWTAVPGSHVESQGSIELISVAGQAHHAELKWQGVLKNDRWKGAVKAKQWPLPMLAAKLPMPGERRLSGGRLNGGLDVSVLESGWHVAGEVLSVDGLRLQREAGEGDEAYAWQAEEARLEGLKIDVAARRFHLKQLKLEDVDALFDPTAQKSAEDGWELRVDEVALQEFRPSVRLEKGRLLQLPALAGSAMWKRGGWQIELDDKEVEGWRIRGEGYLQEAHSSRLTMKVAGAPLVRFRPLLPPLFRSGGAELEGTVKAEAVLSGQGVWHLAGHARIDNAHFAQLGDNWFADSAEIDWAEADASGAGHVKQIRLKGWKYHAPLYPLASPEQQQAPVALSDAREWFGSWQVDRLLLEGGRVAVGQADAVWLEDTNVELSGIGSQAYAALLVRSRFDGGRLFAEGRIGFASARPHVELLKVSVRDVLPFFGREWLHLSGMPALQRGRLYGDLIVQEKEGGWQGTAYARLQHGALEEKAFVEDAMLKRTGFNSYELVSRLSNKGRLRLKISVEGAGSLATVLGGSFVRQVRQQAEVGAGRGPARLQLQTLSQVRLHEREGFSHNERVRLRSAIAMLKKNPKWVVELSPQLGSRELDDETIRQVRYTQQLMAAFMTQRGIPLSRIFPVWPGAQHRDASGSSGIALRAGSLAN